MRGRFGALRTVLAAAGAVAATLAVGAPAVASTSAASALAAAAAGAAGASSPSGGAHLAGRGVIVNYSPGPVPKLPGIKASAWVLRLQPPGPRARSDEETRRRP